MKTKKQIERKIKIIKDGMLCPQSPRAKSKVMALEWVIGERPDLG